MSKRTLAFIWINAVILQISMSLHVYKTKHHVTTPPPPVKQQQIVEEPKKPQEVSVVSSFLSYDDTVKQLTKWNQEVPDITEVGAYGKTSKNKDIYYIRVTNKKKTEKKVVLITACIHGDEPISTATVMGCIGKMLNEYGKQPEVTNLIDTRDIYFVPIVSPDSYPNKRHVDGVDPNRDFPTGTEIHRSVAPVAAIREFFLKIKPNAVISGHAHGRVYLTPWGNTNHFCPNHYDYQRVIGKMATLSGYGLIRACQNYGHPIYGTEVDWYYTHGSFAIVMEFGTNQRIPNPKEIETELSKTYGAILYFIDEGAMVKTTPQELPLFMKKQMFLRP